MLLCAWRVVVEIYLILMIKFIFTGQPLPLPPIRSVPNRYDIVKCNECYIYYFTKVMKIQYRFELLSSLTGLSVR